MDLKNVDIKNVLKALATQSGRNIVADASVSGPVMVSFKNLTFDQSLATILELKGLSSYEQGGTIFISGERPFKTYKLVYAPAAGVKTALTSMFSTTDANFSADETSNMILVRAESNVMREIDSAIKKLDTEPRQVLVEARVIEVSAVDASNVGLNVKYTPGSNVNNYLQTHGLAMPPVDKTPPDLTSQGLFVQIYSGTKIQALLEALSKMKDYSVLASPRVMARENKEAYLYAGEKMGYKTATTTGTVTSEVVKTLDVGVKLTFTPRITETNKIMMDIHPEVSEGSITNNLPNETITEVTTNVVVADGQSIVIAGLLKKKATQEDTGVPLLSQIPFLGSLFRRSEINNQRREIIIIITPYIVRPEVVAEMMQEQKDMEGKYQQKESFNIIH